MEEKLEISKHFEKSLLKKILFDRPILKLVFLIILNFILINLSPFITRSSYLQVILDVLKLLIAIYFVSAVIYIIKNRIEYLMNPSHIGTLILSYAFLVVILILIFSTIVSVAELAGMGYITYNTCSDEFSPKEINLDPLISHSYFYFVAMTFFTVGYGDICPMGLVKILAIVIALVGHVISVILLALIVNNYLKRKKK